ncbi:carboxypeptidase [Aliivibrio finisterrensis]|uniref:Carboxypeptidase n=2 Tax=Vibrionaceae TaxID=641 RepID=A0A4Q5KUL8_9GAMM|nr:carboxypeptidase [Aliivibrio finisterrensis]RYU51047.1 carboxypeptidase [Aliivibrio finisterrensis]RYU56927.1 carboxypeptidase [Aliivibrio finisterrensis]RYU62887.1 carboxypeptidase [Aliivibrio finisterrensis]RYU85320.1 carboxypeptidase [Aliivibrio finisterrensis]
MPLNAQASSGIKNVLKLYETELFYPQQVLHFYQNEQRKWNSPQARKHLENQLALLVLADLNNDLEQRYYRLQNSKELEYDVLATDTLIYLLTYQSQIPEKGKSWFFGGRLKEHLGEPYPQVISSINSAFTGGRLDYLTQTLVPNSDQYEIFYQRLLSYYDPYGEPIEKLTSFKLIRPNQVISYASLVNRLHVAGELTKEESREILLHDNGLYNAELVDVVIRFQKRHGLLPDGIIGPKTKYWLNMSAKERVRIMALNIQRLRLWENKKARFVLVNIPSYEMQYWQEDELLFHSKVIVGKPERKTPLFSTYLDSIVFNPNWKVPTKIMREDILPKAFNDKGFLLSQNFEIVPTWLSDEVIPIEDIDWEQESVETFPYKLRQKSGNSNALGRYKFNTPNRNAIYLHDTPSRSLFKKQSRAYSSGCIRVERASEFAQLLMKESHFSKKEYSYYHQLPETKEAFLSQMISVYTIYQTAWIDEKNQVQFRDDIYKYDQWSKSKN